MLMMKNKKIGIFRMMFLHLLDLLPCRRPEMRASRTQAIPIKPLYHPVASSLKGIYCTADKFNDLTITTRVTVQKLPQYG